jgi:hypothetical protein
MLSDRGLPSDHQPKRAGDPSGGPPLGHSADTGDFSGLQWQLSRAAVSVVVHYNCPWRLRLKNPPNFTGHNRHQTHSFPQTAVCATTWGQPKRQDSGVANTHCVERTVGNTFPQRSSDTACPLQVFQHAGFPSPCRGGSNQSVAPSGVRFVVCSRTTTCPRDVAGRWYGIVTSHIDLAPSHRIRRPVLRKYSRTSHAATFSRPYS